MIKNVGGADRAMRIAVALVLGVLVVAGVVSGVVAVILGVLAVVSLATAFMRFCPLYLPCRISTISRKTP